MGENTGGDGAKSWGWGGVVEGTEFGEVGEGGKSGLFLSPSRISSQLHGERALVDDLVWYQVPRRKETLRVQHTVWNSLEMWPLLCWDK